MSDTRPLQLLLIEDDPDDYLITRDLVAHIEAPECRLDWAASYEDGLRHIRENAHDLYIIDYRLGPHDGLQLVHEVTRLEMPAPVIMLTGLANREADVAAMQAGAMDYLIKGQIDSRLLERAIRYALERHRLLKELREMATHDALTGLYNRRELLRLLDRELERSRRYGRPLTLVWIDVDHFKQINDRHGHLCGDAMLKALTEILRSTFRVSDVLSRYGGDEFAVVMAETPADVATQGAERLRRAVEGETIPLERGDQGRDVVRMSTVSIGVAEYPRDASSREALIDAADRALYQAKRLGNNCVVQFHQELAEATEGR